MFQAYVKSHISPRKITKNYCVKSCCCHVWSDTHVIRPERSSLTAESKLTNFSVKAPAACVKASSTEQKDRTKIWRCGKQDGSTRADKALWLTSPSGTRFVACMTELIPNLVRVSLFPPCLVQGSGSKIVALGRFMTITIMIATHCRDPASVP